MPPKPKATKEDALEVIYSFLTLNKENHPAHYDRKTISNILRDKGLTVPTELNRELDKLCRLSRNTKEFQNKWLDYIFNNANVERKKHIPTHKEWIEAICKN